MFQKTLLKVSNIDTFYGGFQALWNVSLEVHSKEIVALVGANGSGKSTLLDTISGLLRPVQGGIEFEGKNIATLNPFQIVALGISHVPEGRRVFPNMSVLDNLILGSYNRESRPKKEQNLNMVYELFPILEERKKQLGKTLSGGEQQMLALGRGLMSNPKLMLLDEMSLGLAPIVINNVYRALRKIREKDITILFVEQNVRRSLEEADRACIMEAGREVLDKAPIDKILEFSSTIQYQGVLGHSLAMAVKDENEDNTILDGFLTRVADMPALVRGFASGRAEIVGPGWVDEQIKRLKTQGNYSPEGCAVLYSGLPEGSETWSVVAAHGKDVETAYWKQASGYSRTSKQNDAPIAVKKLLDVNRPEAALKIAGNPRADIPSTLLQRLLQELLNMDEKNIRAGVMEEYYLGHVFNQLYQKNDLALEEMAKLEWPFAAFLNDLKRYTSSPMALHRALQKDPQFFSLLVAFIYKRDDRTPDPTRSGITQETAESRAWVANKVLDSWHLIPGLKNDGTLDEKELTDWVAAARKQCAETKHVIGGDVQIGFMLAHAPADPDGTWPHTAVRNLIELLKNEVIDRHIQNEIYNSRGIVSRGLDDGGKQERELAEKYKKMSDAVKVKWPRTSAMLRGIAESYEDQAKYEDVDSDLHDLRWD